MIDGIYGVFCLAEGLLGEVERDWLSIDKRSQRHSCWLGSNAGFRLEDAAPLPGDTGWFAEERQVLGFLGDIDNRESLTKLLGLPQNCPAGQILLNALKRWGDSALLRLQGEWTFLLWDEETRRLTIAASPVLRDKTYFSVVGGWVAIAPSIRYLLALQWVPRQMDELGMLLSLGRTSLRAQLGDRTYQQGILHLQPGTIRHIQLNRQIHSTWSQPPAIEDWHGDFADAVQSMEERARSAVRRRIRRHKTLAVLLSGGLDSSTLAWLTMSEKRSDQRLVAVSSIAGATSGIPDERHWIDLVARDLDIEVHYVVPDETVNVYFPSAQWTNYNEFPLTSPRHYLYEKLLSTAYAIGADAILDGCYGELSLTRYCPVIMTAARGRLFWLRSHWHQSQRMLRTWLGMDTLDLFHVKLAAGVSAVAVISRIF